MNTVSPPGEAQLVHQLPDAAAAPGVGTAGTVPDYHRLYKTAAWRVARAEQLSSEPLCRMCRQIGRFVPANVVDHIRPHKGDTVLFFSQANLQSLCKACHDSHKQAQERHADGILRGSGHDGQPLDLAHPWHRPLPPPAAQQGGGPQMSAALGLRTAGFPPFATCHNSEGGSSV